MNNQNQEPLTDEQLQMAAEAYATKIIGVKNYGEAWFLLYKEKLTELTSATPLQALLKERDAEIERLKDWKESAIKHTPDLQAIGKEIGAKLGTDISVQILPAIQKLNQQLTDLKEENERLKEFEKNVKVASEKNLTNLRALNDYLSQLAKEINVAVDFSNKTYDGDKEAPLDQIGLIEHLRALHTQQMEEAWVPVSERLPEFMEGCNETSDLFIFVQPKSGLFWTAIGRMYPSGWLADGHEHLPVTHWMPLPKPPTSVK